MKEEDYINATDLGRIMALRALLKEIESNVVLSKVIYPEEFKQVQKISAYWQNRAHKLLTGDDTEKFFFDNLCADKTIKTKQWRRYRFYTNSIGDYRPIIFNPKYPWWRSGTTNNGDTAIIVAYLPPLEDLKKYWPDAIHIDFTEEYNIEFSDRFPKPDYFVES